MLVCVQRYTLLLLDGWKVIEICHTCAGSGLLSCHHPDPASTRPRAWPVSVTVCLVSTKYLHIEGCLLLIMLCWLSSSSYSVVLAQCCVVWRRGLDQLSQLINLLVSTFPLFLLFSLFTCYSHYVIIIVLVIIFGQGSITLVLPGRKINNLLSSVHHSSYQNRYECNGYNAFEIKSQECG